MGGGGGGRGCPKAIGTVSREWYGSGTSKDWSSNDGGCELLVTVL